MHKQLKIGAGAPLTGNDAFFGNQLKVGVELAIEDINAKGGLLGQKLELVLGDDRMDPKEGMTVANKFIAEGVTYVVGHFSSSISIATSKEYAEAGIFQISPASTNPKYTDEGSWNSFRICGRDDQQGKVAGNYIAQHLKEKKIAIVP